MAFCLGLFYSTILGCLVEVWGKASADLCDCVFDQNMFVKSVLPIDSLWCLSY